jgi:hypothetical protein
MTQSELSGAVSLRPEELDHDADALTQRKLLRGDRFVLFERSNGSKVACQVSLIHCLAKGDHGSILHFGGGSQINVSQSFDEVLALLNSEP